ncbi:arad-like aldolase/epimerase [Apiospora rasikravindrae]|uniref:Arad-like aldolase/epimerase n=1 Tax=Apiospora rasikravindrae TaxID=990691 RepID=A0ABR1SK36_9PEZI
MDKEALEAAALSVVHRKLINGSHILHHHNVLDAYGHLSVRHPTKPDVFILSRDTAPATVASSRDLVEYWVKDAAPVDPGHAPKGFVERYIHSELYRAYPSIQSVVHSHADAVLPYTINGVPLRPCYHMAGFLGHWSPVWDIASARAGAGGSSGDMLVRTEAFGAALAQQFKYSTTVVLMRGHGFTAVAGAGGIEEAVFRAVYTAQNAAIQTTALTTQAAYHSRNDVPLQPIKFLSPEEAEASKNMASDTVMRPWGLWLREVEASHLYLNSA